MNFWLKICLAVLFVAAFYFVFRVLLLLFAEHELEHDAVKRKENAIEVFAGADALEYYLRMALTAANGEIDVVAYIKKDSEDREDMLDTVSRLRREHKNLSYRWI